MDPASILGVSGVAVQLVELLAKSIKTLSDLQGRWKDADLALLSLKTQLNTLRAALLAICQWVDRHGADENYLLRMELDGSLRCCRLLISKIDLFLNEVRTREKVGGRSSTLDLRKKIKVVFGGSSLDNVLHMIDRQTASMNLLLTACHWLVDTVLKKPLYQYIDGDSHDTLQQKAFLEEPATQEAFQKSKQDTASLYVHSDNDSTRVGTPSVFSTVSSKLSLVFEFDHELFATKVYGIVHRAAVVTSLRRNHGNPPKHSDETRRHSARMPARKSLRKETFVVDGHAREDVLFKCLQTPTIALAEQVALWRRIAIRRVLAYDAIKLIEQWPLDDLYPHDKAVCTMAKRHLQGVVEGHTDLDSPEASEIITRLWELQNVQPLLNLSLTKERWPLLYSLVQASTPEYEPSPVDWEQYTAGSTFRSLQWTSRQPLTIHLTQVDDGIEPKSQLVNQSRGRVSSLHMIDILRLKFTGPLIELLVLLPDLVESGWLQSQSKVIRLGDVELLEEKMQMRGHENTTTMAAKYVHLGFEQISDKTRPTQTDLEGTGEEGDLVHFLIRYPEETILVEYSSLEQDFLRVGVLASKPCLWELYVMAVDGT